jgi:mannose-1-phosphate guanylyltransferase
VQALILAGGEGTRLRPLTLTVPKPVVPLAGRPFIAYMIDWLRGHGIDDVIMACGFMAEGVRRVLGDGSSSGVRLRYIEEPEPLGTGGPLRFAEDLLDERFFMLNGDVLCDFDLTAQLRHHELSGARATLALVGVEDPSAYGLVRLDSAGAVTGFLEKPDAEQIDTNLVNAGAYILERDVLEFVGPPGTACSIERDVFPKLVGRGLHGCPSTGYWLDIGTPERYLQATSELLAGRMGTDLGRAVRAAGAAHPPGNGIVTPALVGAGSVIADGATIGPDTVLGERVAVSAGVEIAGSTVFDGCRIGARTRISASILAADVTVGDDCSVGDGVVLGEGVRIGPRSVLRAGARIFPGTELPEGAIKF